MFKKAVFCAGVLIISASAVSAGPYDEAMSKFPSDAYFTGFAEVRASGDQYKDRRRVEVLSRLDIAKKIKVTIKSNTVDIMCERGGNAVFDDKSECVNMITEIVEESVDEVLEGAEIAEAGEDKAKGTVYAIAVLRKEKAAERAEAGSRESFEKVKGLLEKARAADDETAKQEQADRAKTELIRGMTYAGSVTALDDARSNAASLFDELALEIKKIEDVKKSREK